MIRCKNCKKSCKGQLIKGAQWYHVDRDDATFAHITVRCRKCGCKKPEAVLIMEKFK